MLNNILKLKSYDTESLLINSSAICVCSTRNGRNSHAGDRVSFRILKCRGKDLRRCSSRERNKGRNDYQTYHLPGSSMFIEMID